MTVATRSHRNAVNTGILDQDDHLIDRRRPIDSRNCIASGKLGSIEGVVRFGSDQGEKGEG